MPALTFALRGIGRLLRGVHDSIVRPASRVPLVQGNVAEAELLGPLRQAFPLAVRPDEYRPPLVSVLLLRRRPAAILRRVVAIAVQPVQRVARRPLAHVGKEVLKGSPAVADADSTPAISRVAIAPRPRAAINHRSPRRPSRRAGPSAPARRGLGAALAGGARHTLEGGSPAKAVAAGFRFSPTIAPHAPKGAAALAARERNN